MEKDSLLTGLVLGAILPVIGYFLLESVFEWMNAAGYLGEAVGESFMRRVRTIGIIAICCNILAFEWARKNRYDDTLRGIVFPTVIYVGAWVYKYYTILFS
jgi:hypothetical protein